VSTPDALDNEFLETGRSRTKGSGCRRRDVDLDRTGRSWESDMSKAKDTRKDAKKKPAKSLMEKRAAKKEKRAGRAFRG
jgi:hypothetical protein